MLEAIIFDMDGVLVDSEYTYFQSKSQILSEAGHEVEDSYHFQFMGTTSDYMWEKMKQEFALICSRIYSTNDSFTPSNDQEGWH